MSEKRSSVFVVRYTQYRVARRSDETIDIYVYAEL